MNVRVDDHALDGIFCVDALYFGGAEGSEGFDQELFFAGRLKSNFNCNLGYGDSVGLYPRTPGSI